MGRTMWALTILSEEGYRYDSSIFPIARRRYGMPGAHRWPHRIQTGDGRSILEFPLPTIRFGNLNAPATGGAYLRLLPFGIQKSAVKHFMRRNLPFVLTIHPWELDAEQPRFQVGLRTRWTHYHNLENAERRLTDLLSLATYRPQGEVLSKLEFEGRLEKLVTHTKHNEDSIGS
jgi:hypothetical protein